MYSFYRAKINKTKNLICWIVEQNPTWKPPSIMGQLLLIFFLIFLWKPKRLVGFGILRFSSYDWILPEEFQGLSFNWLSGHNGIY